MPKKKVGKMAVFGPKSWVNPLGKRSIFGLFELVVFIALKGVFFVLKYRKRHFPGLYWPKKQKLEKWPFLDPKPWVNRLGLMSIFGLFELFFIA